jgi:glycerol uptake facilitator-like aquaporin
MIKYFVEFLGTFFFLSVIMVASSSKISWAFLPIGLALSMVIYWGGNISGGHYNPAVSLMFYANNQISYLDTLAYIISQVIGGLGALFFYKMNVAK